MFQGDDLRTVARYLRLCFETALLFASQSAPTELDDLRLKEAIRSTDLWIITTATRSYWRGTCDSVRGMTLPRPCVLGNLSARKFLRDFWQKKPVVIRGAFPNLEDPLSADELAGLACDREVSSRLVMGRGGRRPWPVARGPHSARTLRRLPRSDWTLLVESVDRYSDEIAKLAAAFSFIPRWRIDDVMVSLAPVGGTVGAHVDSYDVFLIQGQGRRRWQVDSHAQPDYRPGLDLRILKEFHVEEEWTLDRGDMLYVPPGVGHRGVTVQGDSPIALTYSVGFRAPEAADLFSSLALSLTRAGSSVLFSDRERAPCRDAGELSLPDREKMRRFLVSKIESQSPDAWAIVVGEAVTSGGHGGPALGPRTSIGSVRTRLLTGQLLRPAAGARVSWCRLSAGRAAVFVNGESQLLSRDDAFAASTICGQASASTIRRIGARPRLVRLVADLLRHRVLVWESWQPIEP